LKDRQKKRRTPVVVSQRFLTVMRKRGKTKEKRPGKSPMKSSEKREFANKGA